MEKLELHSRVRGLQYQGQDWLSQKDQLALKSTKTTSKSVFAQSYKNSGDASMDRRFDVNATDRLLKELALRDHMYTLARERCHYSASSTVARDLEKVAQQHRLMKKVVCQFKRLAGISIQDDKQLLSYLEDQTNSV